jgi:transcriptional/translational regulatory protein YebC/TACO1
VCSSDLNFEKVGNICLEPDEKNPDEIELIAIEAGAKDTKTEENSINILTEPQDLQRVQIELEKSKLKILAADFIFIPKTTIEIDENTRISYEKLLETLDEQDDVQEIYDNL